MASVLVPLAPGVEEMEAITIVDILRRAEINVTTASLDNQPVRASRGTVIIADQTLDEALELDFDMVVLPGGLPGSDHLRDDKRVQTLLKKMANSEKFTAAICAAPKALAQAGLLNGKSATAFPGTLEKLDLPTTKIESSPMVRDGKVITSRSAGTAMDFALELVEILAGHETRANVETALQRN